jgi:hypothetical protein
VLTVERVSIPGDAGMLAGELSYTNDGDAAYVALLLNPHPHMGGSMRNGLIAHLAVDLPRDGAVVLRFDYRGVGGSEGATPDVAASMADFWRTGHAPEDVGMLRDAGAALYWARGQAPELPVVLIGYSFGAAAATQLLADDGVAAAVLIAPTLRQHDFSRAAAPRTPPLLVIYSDNDFATPRSVTESWLCTVEAQRQSIAGGDHFFLGREAEVARACAGFVSRLLQRAEAACS